MDIILYLLQTIQGLYRLNCWLISFICRYIPLKQWAFDDSHSPKYQKFKIDELPLITDFRQDWTYKELIPYFEQRYGKKIRPVSRRSECDIPDSCTCPRCGAPKPFLYKNNGSKGQLLCKVCDARFSPDESRFSSVKLRCPHCGNTLVPRKDRKHFTQVIGLTNDDAVSTEHRPFKQMIERLNRTYKASCRHTNGFDNIDGASYDLALWVAYYNFLRPHKHNRYQVLNEVGMLLGADNMPGKWQLLIFLGQQTILNLRKQPPQQPQSACSESCPVNQLLV